MEVKSFLEMEEKISKLPSLGIDVVNSADGVSTDSLVIDLILGGGIFSNRFYEIVGAEHSGKTTLLYHIMKSCLNEIKSDIKGIFFDLEGKIDPRWFSNIVGKTVKEVFGKKGKKGNWEIEPKIKYYKPQFGEQALRFIKGYLRRIPQKVILPDDGNYYYMYTPVSSKTAKKVGGYTKADLQNMLKEKYDKKLLSKYGSFFVKCEENNNKPECIIFVDSLASMIPQAISDDDSQAIATSARMFTKYINDIKNLLSSRPIALVTINQIRVDPLKWGNPETTPGGNALKHAVDCRIRISSSQSIETEDYDQFKKFKIKTIKSKIFIPFREGEGRWWISHKGKTGCGLDPVIDTINYLKLTGQFIQSKKGFVVNIEGKKKKEFTLKTFKKEILKENKLKLRKILFNQIKSGKGIDLYLDSF